MLEINDNDLDKIIENQQKEREANQNQTLIQTTSKTDIIFTYNRDWYRLTNQQLDSIEGLGSDILRFGDAFEDPIRQIKVRIFDNEKRILPLIEKYIIQKYQP